MPASIEDKIAILGLTLGNKENHLFHRLKHSFRHLSKRVYKGLENDKIGCTYTR
jgi:hypothetical protein